MAKEGKRNIPTILVILGVTGDLTKKKILPALAHLEEADALPEHFAIVGFSRRNWNDADFREYAESISKERLSAEFLKKLHFAEGHFEDDASYVRLAAQLKKIDDAWGVCSNKLFYLAVPPSTYEPILKRLAESGLTEPCGGDEGWTRVLVEKPFGSDAKSAEKLDELLGTLFKEEQIYRIDHYLAKEMLQNVLVFRFTNDLFKDIWNKEHIARIDISTTETLSVDDRGPFYESVGALRDVGQNHLLQMLALMTMDYPRGFTSNAIRARRAEILKTLRVPTPAEVRKQTFRAQYKGYRDVAGVAPKSETETYFRTLAFLDHPNWQGVPISLEAGKRLGEQKKEIVVTLKHPSPCLCPGEKHYEDRIIIRSEPQEEIVVQFWAKKPGFSFELEERVMQFKFREAHERRAQYTEEYEKLLLDCVLGDQTLFVSSAEIIPMWNYTDAIRSEWAKGKPALHIYSPDSPAVLGEARKFMEAPSVRPAAKLTKMPIGILGLGKMGAGIARHLAEQGWPVFGWNRTHEVAKNLAADGISPVETIKELVAKLPKPRVLWLMVPNGKPVDNLLKELIPHLSKGDIVVDGGNSFYKDSIRRAKLLSRRGIKFLDAGVSGGPHGARYGATIMLGGDKQAYQKLEPLFEALVVQDGLGYFGEAGAGHFVKMVHNGIEYGMMQSIAEGFAILKKSRFKPPLQKVAELYNHGSVIESRLVGWLAKAYAKEGEDLESITGKVGYTGEGEWTAQAARELKVPAPIIEGSFKFRVESQKKPSYLGQILSALRNQFGGHKASK